MCRCHSIPLSNGAAEAGGVSTEASCYGLWQAKAVPSSSYHGTQCSICCQQPRPSLLPVLGLDFEEQPHHLLLSFRQRQCRRVQDSATPCSACLWLYPMRQQHISCDRETTKLPPEFLVNYQEVKQHKFISLTSLAQDHFLFLDIAKIFQKQSR